MVGYTLPTFEVRTSMNMLVNENLSYQSGQADI